MVRQIKFGLIIGVFLLIISPLSVTQGVPQTITETLPQIIEIEINGAGYYSGMRTHIKVNQVVDFLVTIDPAVTAFRGYSGTVYLRLWWYHSTRPANDWIEITKEVVSYPESTYIPPISYSIGPMDETSYPNDFGAGWISWYIELESQTGEFEFYPYLSRNTPATTIEFEAIFTTPPVTLPSDGATPADPFAYLDDWLEDIGLSDISSGFISGLSSITGNPFLLVLVIGSGVILTIFIITGRKKSQRGTARRRRRKSGGFNIANLTRRFKRG